jgi:hypothetical protein
MDYLQESHLGDMIKVISAVGSLLKTTKESPDETLVNIIKGVSKRGNYQRSLTSQASKLVMTFPVLASNTIKPDTAVMISKAIERKCTIMIQMLFAADLKIELENSGGIQSVINQYYNGIDFSKLSVDDMIDVVERVSPATYNKYFKETYTAEICRASIKAIMEKCYESDISNSSLNEYYMGSDKSVMHDSTMVLTEKKAPNMLKKLGNTTDPDYFKDNHFTDKDGNVDWGTVLKLDQNERDRFYTNFRMKLDREKFESEKERAAAKEKFDRERYNHEKRLDSAKYKHQLDKDAQEYDLAVKRNNREDKIADAQMKNMQAQLALAQKSGRMDYFKKQLMDSDVKKANELVPSLLVVNYAIDAGPTKELVQTSAIIGIKTRLIPMDSFEILQKLVSKNKDKSGLIKFIRATTGEIRFMKDFVLAIDKAKVDALSRSKKGSVNPIWKVLERRAAISELRKALNQKNDASPITTLVITQEEVDYLKKESGMNMDNVATANYILQAYNLMGLVIVDESTETAKFLFDGEFDLFDTLSYNSIERENGDSNMYKKVINLMSKRM